jgi:hypothetical protein
MSSRACSRLLRLRIDEARMTANKLTIDALERWVLFGAQWRVVHLSDEKAVVDLCACTGARVERLESDDPVLISYVRTAQRGSD